MPSAEQLRSRLLKKLSELFQLDQPDLDFGFYRIMHAKAKEVQDFIQNDLLKIVSDAFGEVDEARKAELQAAYEKAIQTAREFGAPNPEETEPVKKAKAALDAVKDTASAEADVYDHLYRFFERYYDDGDFISRRYYTRETSGKAAPFAVPYNGEEVKLVWANMDQYYIKTTEYFSNFTFDLRQAKEVRATAGDLNLGDTSPLKVHFKIVAATEGEHGNVKASEQNKRYFIIHREKPVECNEAGELVCNFEYRTDPEKTGQESAWRDKRNAEAVETIIKELEAGIQKLEGGQAALGIQTPNSKILDSLKEYLRLFKVPAPTDSDKKRPVLAKYVNQYTARNTMDYFIHKDLGGFLRRELDFYIKNEVMRLDDIENADAPAVESYLTKIKVLRKIAGKLIDFLAQLEDFQKKLWLKKKFIIETNYCITLDRVDPSLLPEIAANREQWAEWRKLGFVEEETIEEAAKKHLEFRTKELEGKPVDLFAKGNGVSAPMDSSPNSYLLDSKFLVLDTRFFDDSFKARLLASIENFDEQCDGLLIHSENFQALNLLQERYREQVKCVYIDPPYNTDGDGFLYKDSYMHSSWLAMIDERVDISRMLLSSTGTIGISIDDNEAHSLERCLSQQFGPNKIGELVVIRAEGGGLAKRIVKGHDYLILYANDIEKCPPLLRPKDIRGKIVDWNGRKYWIETDWLRVEFGKYGTLKYEDILKIKGEDKKREIDEGLKIGYYRLIPNEGGHIVGRLRPVDEDGSKFYSVVKYLNADGMNQVLELFPDGGFGYPKPIGLINHYVHGSTFGYRFSEATILDYFAGSGTTGHAVINLNREDGGKRKYILVEMGDYFDTVLKPRIAKVLYSKDWKDGKPTAHNTGISHCFKYIRLESYEDTLNNLCFNDEPGKSTILNNPSLKEDYMLHYMLDVETRGSQSLLNIDAFADPRSYTLKVKKPGTDEYVTRTVDLIETFNYLIGLRVVHYGAPQEFTATFKRIEDPEVPKDQKTKLVLDGKLQQLREVITSHEAKTWWFRKVEGWVPRDPANPNNGQREKMLIVWRTLTGDIEKDNLMLDEWFQKNRISTRDFEFDTIYVNGSNNLPNLKQDDENWKVRLIEEEFMKRMWNGDSI